MTEKIALVTGANKGLGLATSQALGKLGFRVLMTGRAVHKVEEAATPLRREGISLDCYQADVSSDEDIKKLAAVIREKHGHLEVIVNNAGVLLEATDPRKAEGAVVFSSLFRVDPQVMLKTVNINAIGAARVIQNFAPLMKANNYGRIVNVSSQMGQLSDMDGKFPGYRMSKAALNALTVTAAKELADSNIKVNSICPGWVRTDMGGPSADRSIEEGIRGIIWAATLADDGPTGGFFRDGERLPW